MSFTQKTLISLRGFLFFSIYYLGAIRHQVNPMKYIRNFLYLFVLILSLLFTFSFISSYFHQDSTNESNSYLYVFNIHVVAYPVLFFLMCIPIGMCDSLMKPTKKFRTISSLLSILLFLSLFLYNAILNIHSTIAALAIIQILAISFMLFRKGNDSWLPEETFI